MYIDLTQTFTNNMPVYPGDEKSELVKIADVATDGATDHRITSAMHVGTHIDAPAHMVAGGKSLSDFPVEKFFGRGAIIDARGLDVVDEGSLLGREVKKGDIVLINFGWSEKFTHPDYYLKFPVITEAFAKRLVELDASIIGLDSPSPDRPPYKVHKILLTHNILIIENLTNLESLLQHKTFEVIALPAKFQTEAAACRVVAKINEK